MILRYWTDDDQTRRSMPAPTDLAWELNDVDKNSGRNDYGLMMREVLGKKNKLTLKWSFIEDSEELRTFVRWAKNLPPFFYVQFVDASGEVVEMECYTSKIGAALAHEDGLGTLWKDMSINFTER